MAMPIVESVKGPAQVTTLQRFVQGGLKANALRTNNLLRKDEWELLDTRVVDIARQRLNLVADLRNAGLVRDLGGLGVILDQYETISDMTDANVDMSGVAPGEEDSVGFTLHSVPIPIVHKDFRVNIRRLEASRKLGAPIDTTQAETATRKVRDKLEDIVANGAAEIQVDGNTLEGYTNATNRNTGTFTAAWTDTANRDIIQDVLDMIADAEADNYFGPYTLYVNSTYWSELRADYKAESDMTYRERIEAIDSIDQVKPADVLDNSANPEVVLVQMTRDVVELSVGQDIVPVEWETQGGLVSHFKVMAAMAPRVKSDDNNNSGIVHYTES